MSMLTLLLALILLHRPAAGTPCAIPGAPCALSSDMHAWNAHVPGFANRTRFWDLSDLKPAMRHLGSELLAQRLLDKLNAGRPITAVAIGSSFVANFAGCFHTSLNALYGLGILPNPHIYPQPGQDASVLDKVDTGDRRLVTNNCASGGFMEGFMNTLNHSWPNHGHIFLNSGKGGVSLWHLSEAWCLSTHIPEEVDLVVLDPRTNRAHPFTAEKLMRLFLGSHAQPLVMILSNTRNCQDLDPPPPGHPGGNCMACLGNGGASAACANLPAEPYSDAANRELSELSQPYQNLAMHYDIPHVDVHALIQRSFLGGDAKLHERLGLTKWQLLARLYMDDVHPTKDGGGLGTLLLADVLVAYLYSMQQRLATMTPNQRQSLGAQSYRLPSFVYNRASTTYRSRCYGVAFKQVLDQAHARLGASGASAADQAALKELREASGGFFGSSMANEGGEYFERIKSLPPLNVTANKGFEVQGYYRTPSGVKFKPGYLASTAGATLEFELSTRFPELPAGQQAEIVITYTTSYDGWGRAVVSCVSGCTCTQATVDAHVEERHSLMRPLGVQATQHERCRARVQVANETSFPGPSSGHKFKVSSVMVRIVVTF